MRDEKLTVTYTCDVCKAKCNGDYIFELEQFKLNVYKKCGKAMNFEGYKGENSEYKIEEHFCSRSCFEKFLAKIITPNKWYVPGFDGIGRNVEIDDWDIGEKPEQDNADYIKSVVEDCRKIIERQSDFDLAIVGKRIVAGHWISRRAWKEGTYIGWWGEHLHKCDSESQQNSRWFPTKQDLTATDYYIPYVTGNCVECKEKKCPGYYHAR